MKVLLVNKFLYPKGGSETYFFSLADMLRKHSHEVVFFGMQDENNIVQSHFCVSKKDYTQGRFFTQLKNGLQLLYSQEAKRKMDSLLKAEKPDLAVLNLVHRQLTLSILEPLRKHNIPVLFIMHDWVCVCPNCTMLSNGQICEKCVGGHYLNCVKRKCVKASTAKSFLAAIEAYFYRWRGTYNKVDLYIAPSMFLQQKLKKSGFTHAPIEFLRNLLPPDTVYELPEQTDNYFLYFGRLSSEKGILTLLKAVGQLSKPIELRIAGDGPQRGVLEQFVRQNRLKERITFLGFQTGQPLRELVERSKCVVLPSEWYENCPYSVMEAMAKGRPCIVSNQGGLPELVENGRNGFVFEAGNIEALSSAISRMLSLTPEQYSKMCVDTMNKAKEDFNSDRYLDRLLGEYHKLKPAREDNNE
jgi:glycosyltransferase involved in cell wall biosynthesis